MVNFLTWPSILAFNIDTDTLAISAMQGAVEIVDSVADAVEQVWRVMVDMILFPSFVDVRMLQRIDGRRRIAFCTGSSEGIKIYDRVGNRRW